MNQNEFRETKQAVSQNEKVLTCLMRSGLYDGWVPMTLIAREMGGYAVHSRISDLRKRGHAIEHKCIYSKALKKRYSFYKLIH